MSFCVSSPRLGTLPRESENVRVSVVRLSSRTFSLGGVGGAGVTGLGKVVVVGGPLLGRKIVLKPVPANCPVKFARTPSGDDVVTVGVEAGASSSRSSPNLPSTSEIWKSDPRVMTAEVGGVVSGAVAASTRIS
jgi:hypothetical protein